MFSQPTTPSTVLCDKQTRRFPRRRLLYPPEVTASEILTILTLFPIHLLRLPPSHYPNQPPIRSAPENPIVENATVHPEFVVGRLSLTNVPFPRISLPGRQSSNGSPRSARASTVARRRAPRAARPVQLPSLGPCQLSPMERLSAAATTKAPPFVLSAEAAAALNRVHCHQRNFVFEPSRTGQPSIVKKASDFPSTRKASVDKERALPEWTEYGFESNVAFSSECGSNGDRCWPV